MIRKIFFLVILSFLFFSFSAVHSHAFWAKRFDSGASDMGGIWPKGDGAYYLLSWQFVPNDPNPSKQYLLFSGLNSSGAVQWTKKIYKGDYDVLMITEMGDGGFFVNGTIKTEQGDENIIWAKFNSSWTPVYGKVFGGTRDESIGFIDTDDGGFIGTGDTNSYGDENDHDMLIIKTNSSGNIQWSRVFHHGLDDSSPQILKVGNEYLLCSSVANTLSGGKDILVAKLDSNGAPQWVKLYGGTGINEATIQEISGGNFFLLGTTKTDLVAVNTDIILIKIDSSGNIIWQKKYSSDKANTTFNIAENPDGTFILDGTTTGMDLIAFTFNSDILLMKLSSSGGIIWQKTLGGSGYDFATLTKTTDGNYLLTGTSTSFGSGSTDYDVLFAKLDSLEPVHFLWQRAFGDNEADMAGVVEMQNNYFLTGATSSFGASSENIDVLGVTLDSSGNYPGGCHIKDVDLPVADSNLTENNPNLTQTDTSLTSRQHGAATDIALTVETATITTFDICQSTQEEQHTLTVTKAGTGDGTVSSTMAGINCGADCTETYNHNDSVTLTAAPAAGSTFTGWSGACTGTGNCALTMDSDKTATATFTQEQPQQRTLTVTKAGAGSGTATSSDKLINCGADCGEPYPISTKPKKVTLKEKPDANSYFAGWAGDCAAAGTKSSCTLTMDSDKNATANFLPNPTLTLTKSGEGNGNVKSAPKGIDCGVDCTTGDSQFKYKAKAKLTAKADQYSTFLGWSGDACIGITKPTCKVSMDASKNVTAQFGLPDISVSPAEYNFGDVKIKTQAGPVTFTITNNGIGDLKITKMEITGTDAKMFKIKGGGKKTIKPGASLDFSVTFKPTTTGEKAATLRITSNDPDEPVVEIPLSGKGVDSILTIVNAPQAAGAIIQTGNLLGPVSYLGLIGERSSSISSVPLKTPIRHIIGKVMSISTGQGHKTEMHKKGSMPQMTENCQNGGTISVSAAWTGSDNPTDPSQIINLTANMSFTSCKESELTMNGKIKVGFEGSLSNPTKLTISSPNLAYTDTSTNDNITMNKLTIVVAEFIINPITYELTNGTVTIDGGISGTVDGDPLDVECDEFTMEFSSSSAGTNVSISGGIKASCLGDWVTIATSAPIFVPVDADCPTAGEVIITSGTNNVKIVIASDHKITVYLNDAVVQTYNNCEEVDGLCS